MKSPRPPKYRHFRPKNLAVVRIHGRDRYLGPYGSPESWEKYHQLLAEALAQQRTMETQVALAGTTKFDEWTINHMLNAYRKHAETYYAKNGQPTKEFVGMKYAARPLRRLYGSTWARDFGPLALKAVRQYMINTEKLSRGVINNRVNRIKRIFKWAVSEELVPPSVYEGIRTVDGLRFGRTTARETEPVKPVPWEWVAPVLPHVSSPVATMVQLQWLTAMRPCEVVLMRACDIDMSGTIWVYEPHDHKNRWRGHRRLITLGPRAQELLKPFLGGSNEAYLFSPRAAEAERNAKRRAARKFPLTPSQAARRPKRNPKRAKCERYSVPAYRRAITYGIAKANKLREANDKIPGWFPLQLRHSRATEVRKLYGLEAAQATLGHARADVTQVYAERNLGEALRIAQEIGQDLPMENRLDCAVPTLPAPAMIAQHGLRLGALIPKIWEIAERLWCEEFESDEDFQESKRHLGRLCRDARKLARRVGDGDKGRTLAKNIRRARLELFRALHDDTLGDLLQRNPRPLDAEFIAEWNRKILAQSPLAGESWKRIDHDLNRLAETSGSLAKTCIELGATAAAQIGSSVTWPRIQQSQDPYRFDDYIRKLSQILDPLMETLREQFISLEQVSCDLTAATNHMEVAAKLELLLGNVTQILANPNTVQSAGYLAIAISVESRTVFRKGREAKLSKGRSWSLFRRLLRAREGAVPREQLKVLWPPDSASFNGDDYRPLHSAIRLLNRQLKAIGIEAKGRHVVGPDTHGYKLVECAQPAKPRKAKKRSKPR